MTNGDVASFPESAIAFLQAQLKDKASQVEDLKRDKDDLRLDKERAFKEVSRLADELKAAKAELEEHIKGQESSHIAQHGSPFVEGVPAAAKRKRDDSTHSGARKKGRPRKIREALDIRSAEPIELKCRQFEELSAVEPNGSSSGRRSRSFTPPQDPADSGERPSMAVPCVHIRELPPSSINKNEAFVFTETSLKGILKNTPDLVIDPAADATAASRDFLHVTYGGNPYQSVQFVKKNPSGANQRMFIFPNHEVNPSLPFRPGQAGLVIDNRYFRAKAVDFSPWSLFRKVSEGPVGKKATWLYLGEYEYKPVGKMSKDVFCCQNDLVRQNWAEQLLVDTSRQSLNEVHFAMRARVGLRKAGLLSPGRQLSPEAELVLVNTEIARVKAGKGHPVDRDDILAALMCGEEAIDISILKCVKYDRVLAEDIATKFPLHVPGKKTHVQTTTITSKRNTRGRAPPPPPGVATPVSGTFTNSGHTSDAIASATPVKMTRLAEIMSNPGPLEGGIIAEAKAEDEDGDHISCASEDALVDNLAYP